MKLFHWNFTECDGRKDCPYSLHTIDDGEDYAN